MRRELSPDLVFPAGQQLNFAQRDRAAPRDYLISEDRALAVLMDLNPSGGASSRSQPMCQRCTFGRRSCDDGQVAFVDLSTRERLGETCRSL